MGPYERAFIEETLARRARMRPARTIVDNGIDLRRKPEPPPVVVAPIEKPSALVPEPPPPTESVPSDGFSSRERIWLSGRRAAAPGTYARVPIRSILAAVSQKSGVSVTDLVSYRRTANVVFPRQIAMYLAKTLTLQSYPAIGRELGGRDHTTALHGFQKIDRLRSKPTIAALLQSIVLILRDQGFAIPQMPFEAPA